MSKGFIGLDNPSFQGNLRTHRRRTPENLRVRQTVKPVGVLDDINDADQISLNLATPKPNLQSDRNNQPTQTVNYLPQTPATHNSPAGSVSIISSGRAQDQPNRTQRFERWRNEQTVPTNSNSRLEEKRDQVEVVSYEQFVAEQTLEKEPKLNTKWNKFKFSKKDIFTIRFALPAMAVLIFLVGCGVALQGLMTNQEVKAQVAELSSSTTAEGYDPNGQSEVPDETQPDEKTSGPYIVAPNMPRYIRINKIGVNNRVIRVGVKPNNELIAPNNIHNVGWYDGSSLPGNEGTALMDAHVHGPTMPGAFYKIGKLSTGDEIEVEMGDGRKFYYEVASKESKPYDQVDMSKAVRSAEEGKNGLNLITCGGKYNRDTHMYEERVVVYAVQK